MSGINITVEGLDEAQRKVVSLVSPKRRAIANKVGARAAQQALKAYHKSKGRQMWITPGPTHGPGRRQSGWYKQVAAAWGTESVSADGAALVNGANYFAHKVRGGTIKAKRVRFLTIPLIPEAHGKTARQYAQENRVKLFTIPGTAVLFAQSKRSGSQSLLGRTVGRSRGGKKVGLEARTKISAVFALKRSVNQKPTPGALPESKIYVGPFEVAMIDELLKD